MTVAQILTDLKAHNFSSVDDVHSLRLLNDTYQEVCMREPWPFLENELNTNTVAANDSLSMPTDWSKTLTLTLYTSTSSGVSLEPTRLDDIQKIYPVSTTGVPRFYYFINNQIYLFPTPDGVYTVNHLYVRHPVDLLSTSVDTDILLPSRHHRVLSIGTLAKLYWMRDRGKQAQAYDVMYEHRIAMMRQDLWKQQYDQNDYIHRVDEDNYDYANDWGF